MKAALLIIPGLLLAALAGYVIFEGARHTEEKYHDRLNRIAKTVNEANLSWKAGTNARWQDIDINGVLAHVGTLLDNGHGIELQTVDTVASDIPESFDAREQWGANCSSLWEVRDQSTCGSCWAFGAVESLSDRHCIHTGQDIRLSATNMLACCKTCGNGCNGGYPISAMKYYVNTGLVTGDLYGTTNWCQAYPFAPCAHHTTSTEYPACSGDSSTPKCVKSCDADSTYTTSYANDIHKGSKAYSIDSKAAAIQTEIMTNGPIEVAFTVYEDFLTYTSGVYTHHTGSQLGGHAVKMVGWGVENGINYWLCVNSWNNTWGDNGTFKIAFGQCGIQNGCVAALPKV